MARPALAVVAALALLGCREERPAFDPSSDRTLQKLQAERARLAAGGAPATPPAGLAPPTDPLAEAAAAQAAPVPLEPPGERRVTVGPVTLELRRAEVMQTLRTARASVSTADRFVRVVLHATAAQRAPISLARAELVRGDQRAGVALDVQRLGQGSPLETAIEPGVEQELVLVFEVPPVMVGPGLTLSVPAGAETVEVRLR